MELRLTVRLLLVLGFPVVLTCALEHSGWAQTPQADGCWCKLEDRTTDCLIKLPFAECRQLNGHCLAFLPGPGHVLHPAAPRAVIDDPDRYTNVRSGPGGQFDIIAEVREGQIFRVTPRSDAEWWHVLTPDRRAMGFMHRSRIRLLGGR
jgi:uncharacterized protein YgiM (DUF1202 family)